MTETELPWLVKLIIREHRGRENAITGRSIAAQCGMKDDRQVRLAIRDLIKDGWPIASATEPPAGYYLVETLAEAEAYKAGLRSRLIEDAKRRRDFKVAAARMFDRVSQGRLI